MPGTLVVTTLSDGTTSTSATNAIRGGAKVWAQYGYISAAMSVSGYNISSATRNSTGDYTLNFTSSLSDANYAATAAVCEPFAASIQTMKIKASSSEGPPALKSTSQLGIIAASAYDMNQMYTVIHGN
jgi:hypothetical protein